ncbi:hypothetical protein AURDEDRAFT_156600 [Auricularia subglabra TFB-10046 SS5]|nr:hypothetical protein AURDEDRAFT_156600 [Auricularia subglabra TFB-10046 SS5]
MNFATLQSLVVLVTAAAIVIAKDCSGDNGGIGNGEGPLSAATNLPVKARNCFAPATFNSLHAAGDGTYGTNCVAYLDTDCQQEMTETGNTVVGSGRCINVPQAKSMRCFYRC